MTKSEAAAAQARCDAVAASDALSTVEFGADRWDELRAALADRQRCIEALWPFAHPSRSLPAAHKAFKLLESMGEFEIEK